MFQCTLKPKLDTVFSKRICFCKVHLWMTTSMHFYSNIASNVRIFPCQGQRALPASTGTHSSDPQSLSSAREPCPGPQTYFRMAGRRLRFMIAWMPLSMGCTMKGIAAAPMKTSSGHEVVPALWILRICIPIWPYEYRFERTIDIVVLSLKCPDAFLLAEARGQEPLLDCLCWCTLICLICLHHILQLCGIIKAIKMNLKLISKHAVSCQR